MAFHPLNCLASQRKRLDLIQAFNLSFATIDSQQLKVSDRTSYDSFWNPSGLLMGASLVSYKFTLQCLQ